MATAPAPLHALSGALLIVALGAPAHAAPPAARGSADLVVRGAAVYTMDAARTWADAIAVKDGRIVFVGPDSELGPWIGGGTRVVRQDGGMVLPGFHDVHVHPASGGVELGLCDLNGATSAEEVKRRIRAFAGAHPDVPWITGGGYDLPLFEDGAPTRELLDELVPDRPAYLTSSDGHSAWVNGRALELAGVDARTPDPAGGRIVRRAGSREPAGTLRESAADLVARVVPPFTPEQYRQGLLRGLAMARGFGITSLIEASASEPIALAYQALSDGDELDTRVVLSLALDASVEDPVKRLEALRARLGGPRLRASTVKIFADGVIEGGTAAVLEPYIGTSEDQGLLNYPPADLAHWVQALDASGFDIHIHAIGDRAIRVSLDALEAAARANGPRDRRPHLAHVQLIDPRDIARFRPLGVTANIQPLWAFADRFITDLTEPRLGQERSRWLYPFASLVAAGARLAAGSDWSVSSMDPLQAIQVAVTRQSVEEPRTPVWLPEERLELPTILAAYTISAAWLMRQEEETGSLEVGKAGDLAVLDRNLFELAPTEISTARVTMTVLDGEVIYERGADRGRAP